MEGVKTIEGARPIVLSDHRGSSETQHQFSRFGMTGLSSGSSLSVLVEGRCGAD